MLNVGKRNRPVGASLWNGERRYTPDRLSIHSQHLAAGSQNRQPGASVKERFSQGTAGPAEVLAVVQDHQHFAVGNESAEVIKRVNGILRSGRSYRRPDRIGTWSGFSNGERSMNTAPSVNLFSISAAT